MKEIFDNIPWSGVAFILGSVIAVVFWMHDRGDFFFIILFEFIWFFICFYTCDKEGAKKYKTQLSANHCATVI